MTGLKDFSTDASSNDVAAPPINWQEGMPANVYNNSARAMMAALACWHLDVSGSITASGGASGALALATNQGFVAADFNKPFEIAFLVDAASPGPSTLNLDGTGSKPLVRPLGIQLAPSSLIPGVVYRARWQPGLACFTVLTLDTMRPGAFQAFASTGSVPPDWLICDGRSLSRVSYAALFSAIGGIWGAGDGTTIFNIPDLRGRSLFGVDGGAGRITGAAGVGATLAATGGTETVTLNSDQLASHSHTGSTAAAGGHDHGGSVALAGQHSHGSTTQGAGGHTHGATSGTAGAHAHSGTTNSNGTHGHSITYSIGTAGSGSTNRVVTDLEPNGANNAGGATDGAGAHTHDFTTAVAGDHAHTVSVTAVGDHVHGIVADGQHQHAITAVGDHSHGLTIAAAGQNSPHSNMPPAAVVIWAIKA